MTTSEAIGFYATRYVRSRCKSSQLANYTIMTIMQRNRGDMRAARLVLADLATDPTPQPQRRIYQKALREIEI